FNNNTDFTDYSTYSNDGTNSGSTYTDSGKFGGARSFDGNDDYVSLGDISDYFEGNDEISVFTWVYPAGKSEQYAQIIGLFSPGTDRQWALTAEADTDTFKGSVYNSTSDAYVSTPWTYQYEQWYYVGFVYDGSYIRLYVNGTEIANTIHTGNLKTVSYTAYIGQYYRLGGGDTRVFNGTIDEVIIFNRALTAEEINASYNAGLYRLEANMTDLTEGTYTYTAYAQDLAGNINQTETRTLTIDATAPTLTIDTPTANGTYYSYAPDFDGTCTDNNAVSYIWTDLSEYPTMDPTSPFNFTNMTGLTDQDYTINISCNDTAGNTAVKTMYFTFDTTDPSIGFIAPTEDNDSYINEDYTYINVTATDVNNITAFIDWNNSLVGWWRFNNESGENNTFVKDWSSYGNNGTNSSNPTYATGKFGKAVQFDGSDDYIKTEVGGVNLENAQDMTVDLWVNPSSRPTINGNMRVIIQDDSFYITQQWSTGETDSHPVFSVQTKTGDYHRDYSSSDTLPLNTWTHVVGIYNSSIPDVIYYINGIQVADTPSAKQGSGDLDDIGTNPTRFGYINDEYFNGTIDEVKIWNRALTAEEINASYNAGLYRLEANITDLTEGTYTYTAYAQDLAGNTNSTETRTLTIDSTAPTLMIDTPTANGTYYGYAPNFDGTCTDNNAVSYIWTDLSEYPTMDPTSPFNFTNTTGLTDQDYTINISCNDTAGNTAVKTMYFTFDSTDPSIGFTAPTEDNDSYISEDYTYINTTVTDANLNSTAFIDWNNSLVGWWRFNNESGENNTFVKDWSSYGNNGTCTGNTCSNYTTGKFGEGMLFDGTNDSLKIESLSSINFGTGDLTFSTWIKTLDSNYKVILKKANSAYPFEEYELSIMSSTQIRGCAVDCGTGACGFGSSRNCLEGNINVVDGLWHHILYLRSSTSQNIYVDGQLINSLTETAWDTDNSDYLYIGSHNSVNYFFNGTIDEVRIYNRALTPTEINASYNAGLYRLEANMTDLAEGTYTYTAYAQDLAGNLNQTDTRTLTIDTIILAGCDYEIHTAPFTITQNNSVYCLDQDLSISSGTAITFSAGIQNTTVDCKNYNLDDTGTSNYGVYLAGLTTTNNTIKNCNMTDFNYGIYLMTQTNNNYILNNTLTNNNNGLVLNVTSSKNNFVNNTITGSSYGFSIYSGSNNTISEGSIHDNTIDYYIETTDTTNSFTTTNFTSQRKIYFDGSNMWFNYNNDTTQNIWLNTTTLSSQTLTRTLINWNNQLTWNDTNSTAGITATYNLTGFYPNTTYSIYNASNATQTNPVNLTTDTYGILPSFTIALDGETQINVVDNNAPDILFISPTEDNNKYIINNYAYINTTITDNYNSTAFIDW
ncbi:MAG: hypothetical protein KAI18_02235, partial [Candidatus Aenigmarchaeota archaeon]|nr:hypothetical protein [Candidatus Aenigmarchaeota archaeon]